MPFLQYNHGNQYKYFKIPENKRVVFGREDAADFQMQNDSLISRKHFVIERDPNGEFALIELGARNGTYLNGKRLNQETIQLSDGDEIKAGKQSFVYLEQVAKDAVRKTVIEMSPFAGESFSNQEEAVAQLSESRNRLLHEMRKVIIGHEEIINHILIALIARGHCLLIGVPGLAKTLIVRVLAGVLDLDSNRVQFTPDLMPSDITGTDILEEDSSGMRRFRFNYGPVFTNILLADEINRTPPKTQAALLQAMQEHKVTASGESYDLPQPFLVLATQNPIEQEGTYPLPEAQLDRFMFSLNLAYPDAEEEKRIIIETTKDFHWEVEKVLNAESIIKFQHLVRQVPVSDHVALYASQLVRATRPGQPDSLDFINRWVRWGAGPRAGQYLLFAAKAHVLLNGRFNVSCADVKKYAVAVLRHRIFLNFSAGSEDVNADDVIRKIVETVKEPDYKS